MNINTDWYNPYNVATQHVLSPRSHGKKLRSPSLPPPSLTLTLTITTITITVTLLSTARSRSTSWLPIQTQSEGNSRHQHPPSLLEAHPLPHSRHHRQRKSGRMRRRTPSTRRYRCGLASCSHTSSTEIQTSASSLCSLHLSWLIRSRVLRCLRRWCRSRPRTLCR